MKYWHIPVLLFIMLACAEKPRKVFELPLDAPFIIAGTEGKTWRISEKYRDGNRLPPSNCDTLYRISFMLDGSVRFHYQDSEYCESGVSGKWNIIREKDGQAYVNLNAAKLPDSTIAKLLINDLSGERLEWEHSKRKPDGFRTTVREVLIPQGFVKDRD